MRLTRNNSSPTLRKVVATARKRGRQRLLISRLAGSGVLDALPSPGAASKRPIVPDFLLAADRALTNRLAKLLLDCTLPGRFDARDLKTWQLAERAWRRAAALNPGPDARPCSDTLSLEALVNLLSDGELARTIVLEPKGCDPSFKYAVLDHFEYAEQAMRQSSGPHDDWVQYLLESAGVETLAEFYTRTLRSAYGPISYQEMYERIYWVHYSAAERDHPDSFRIAHMDLHLLLGDAATYLDGVKKTGGTPRLMECAERVRRAVFTVPRGWTLDLPAILRNVYGIAADADWATLRQEMELTGRTDLPCDLASLQTYCGFETYRLFDNLIDRQVWIAKQPRLDLDADEPINRAPVTVSSASTKPPPPSGIEPRKPLQAHDPQQLDQQRRQELYAAAKASHERAHQIPAARPSSGRSIWSVGDYMDEQGNQKQRNKR